MLPQRSHRLFLLLLAAAVVVFHFRGLLPGQVFLPLDALCGGPPFNGSPACAGVKANNLIITDQVLAFYPWHSVVRQGGWGAALWNPLAFAGSPMLANGQSALLYPPNWLHLILPPTWSYVLAAMLRTALALGFTFAFARRRVSAAAAALAAASYAFSFNFIFYVGFPLGDAAALMPALFWAIDARRWIALGAATLFELLAGQPELSLVAFLAAGIYFVFQRPPFRDWLRAGAAVLAGALCAAPQVLLTLQYVRWSAASRLRAEYNPLFYSAHTLLDFLTPGFFGMSSPEHHWGSNEGGYFGLLPALLALAWVISRAGRRHEARSCGSWP